MFTHGYIRMYTETKTLLTHAFLLKLELLTKNSRLTEIRKHMCF